MKKTKTNKKIASIRKKLINKPASYGKKSAQSLTEKIKDEFQQLVERVTQTFTQEPTDLISAIEQDHEGLRQFIGVLKDTKRDMSERRRAYDLFSALLKSHTVAEETAVYAPLEKPAKNDLVIRIKEGYVEHQVANDVMDRLDKIDDPKEWSAHANVLAELVEHHLDEEEKEMFPLIRKQISKKLEADLIIEFLRLRALTQTKISRKNAGVLEVLRPMQQ